MERGHPNPNIHNQRRLGKPQLMCFVALLYAVLRSIPCGFEGSKRKIVDQKASDGRVSQNGFQFLRGLGVERLSPGGKSRKRETRSVRVRRMGFVFIRASGVFGCVGGPSGALKRFTSCEWFWRARLPEINGCTGSARFQGAARSASSALRGVSRNTSARRNLPSRSLSSCEAAALVGTGH